MSEKRNDAIRTALRVHDVKQWRLAESLGIGESTLCVKLRNELPEAEQRKIIAVIEKIAADAR